MDISTNKISVAIFFGWDSNERNISLDSARTFYDSLRYVYQNCTIHIYFVSQTLEFFLLPREYIYSNTIQDFESWLLSSHTPLTLDQIINQNDIFCPMIHGSYWEDWRLTAELQQKWVIAILWSNAKSLALTMNKNQTARAIQNLGLHVPNHVLILQDDRKVNHKQMLTTLQKTFADLELIVKPNDCGSSDWVQKTSISTLDRSLELAFQFSDNVLVEEYITWQEFSIIVVQDLENNIIPLLPTGVVVANSLSQSNDWVYTRHKKYMPGSGAHHMTPVTLDADVIATIRDQAKKIFSWLEMSDWWRFDWFIDQTWCISRIDINSIPWYGQDSFLFQQMALFGFDHVSSTHMFAQRTFNKLPQQKRPILSEISWFTNQKHIAIVWWGQSSEKNVSRMSRANVTQKLSFLQKYSLHRVFQTSTWEYREVPLFVALQHTIEEIEAIIIDRDRYAETVKLCSSIVQNENVFSENALTEMNKMNFLPFQVYKKDRKSTIDFVFIALHWWEGEDWTLQWELETLGIPFNWSWSDVSALCMDKYKTNSLINQANLVWVQTPNQLLLDLSELKQDLQQFFEKHWIKIQTFISDFALGISRGDDVFSTSWYQEYNTFMKTYIDSFMTELWVQTKVVLKPHNDWCSSWVLVCIDPYNQIPLYIACIFAWVQKIPFWLLHDWYAKDSEYYMNMPTSSMTSSARRNVPSLFDILRSWSPLLSRTSW